LVADAYLENLTQPGASDINSQLAFGELPGDAMAMVFRLRDDRGEDGGAVRWLFLRAYSSRNKRKCYQEQSASLG
jgi:hypothetical protein